MLRCVSSSGRSAFGCCGLALQLGDPAVDVFAQSAAADEAKAVVVAEVFALDDDVGHGGGVKS